MASSVSQAQKGPRNSLKPPSSPVINRALLYLGQDKVIPPEFYYVFTTEKAEEAFRRPESIKEWPPRSDESLRFLADAADLAAASIRADEPSRFPTKWYWLDSVLNQVIRGIRAMDELDKEPWNPEWDNSDQLVYFDKLAPLKPCCQYVFGEEDAERASRSSLFLLEQQKADKCPGLLTIAARLILKDDAAGPDQFEDPLHWLDSYLATAIIQVHPELEALLDTGSEEEPSDSDDSEYTEERPLPSGPSQHSGSQAQRKPRGKAEKSADTKRTEALPFVSVEVEALRKQVDDLKEENRSLKAQAEIKDIQLVRLEQLVGNYFGLCTELSQQMGQRTAQLNELTRAENRLVLESRGRQDEARARLDAVLGEIQTSTRAMWISGGPTTREHLERLYNLYRSDINLAIGDGRPDGPSVAPVDGARPPSPNPKDQKDSQMDGDVAMEE
ncbi:hypothetical protein BDZ89DRAFT_1128541 [Hymenopellis radicata]|nr:hypothetical protein BDZ89DRAFT_1128541 [Hymenopellis radicata]